MYVKTFQLANYKRNFDLDMLLVMRVINFAFSGWFIAFSLIGLFVFFYMLLEAKRGGKSTGKKNTMVIVRSTLE